MQSFGKAIGLAFGVLLLLGPTVVVNIPLLAVCFVLRRRLGRRRVAWLVATGFLIAGAWWWWQIEWYDVWRHGIPSATYLLTGYAPRVLAVAWIGWSIGRWIGRERQLVEPLNEIGSGQAR